MWKEHTASLVVLALATIFISGICFGEESSSPLTYQEKQKLLRNEHLKKCSSVNKNTSSVLKSTSRQSSISTGANLLYTDYVPSAAVDIPDGTHISTATHWNQANYYIHGMVYVDPNVLFAISGNIYFDSSASNAGIVLSSGVKFIAEGKSENPIKIQSGHRSWQQRTMISSSRPTCSPPLSGSDTARFIMLMQDSGLLAEAPSKISQYVIHSLGQLSRYARRRSDESYCD